MNNNMSEKQAAFARLLQGSYKPGEIYVKIKNPRDPAYQFNTAGLAKIFGVAASSLRLAKIPVLGPYDAFRPCGMVQDRNVKNLLEGVIDRTGEAPAVAICTDAVTLGKMKASRPDLILDESNMGPLPLLWRPR